MANPVVEPLRPEPVTDVSTVRARIAEEIEGLTVTDLLEINALQDGDEPALNWREGDRWRSLTWAEYRARVEAVAVAFAELGVEPRDVVGIMANNRPEHAIADLAALYAAATPVTFYSTLAPDQIRYIATDSGTKLAIVEDRETAERWLSVKEHLPRLRYLVMLEPDPDLLERPDVLAWEDVLARGREAVAHQGRTHRRTLLSPDDPATIIYTSGTTGPPKGVVIPNRQIMWVLATVKRVHRLPRHATAVSYLPLAHIAERMFTHYTGLDCAGSVYFCPETRQALDYLRAARPSAFLAVPRVWEKMQSALLAKVEAEAGVKGRLARTALEVGRDVAHRRLRGEEVPLALRLEHQALDRIVLSKIREQIGLDRCDFALTAAAPISVEVLEFFAGLGILINEVYGMTETSSLISANRPGRVRLGTVGEPIPGVEVKIADDGEILCRGPNLAAGYLNRPEATAETWGDDGWLRTGDLGWLTDDGYLEITGRKKELIITSSGKNISPSEIEHRLKMHPLVGQACAVGDGKPYVSALIVLDPETTRTWAEREGIPFDGVKVIATHPKLETEIERAVDQANAQLARIEQVKRFAILPVEWTAESAELTPTLKLRRHVIKERYGDVIASLYAGLSPSEATAPAEA